MNRMIYNTADESIYLFGYWDWTQAAEVYRVGKTGKALERVRATMRGLDGHHSGATKDTYTDHLWLVDTTNQRILRFDKTAPDALETLASSTVGHLTPHQRRPGHPATIGWSAIAISPSGKAWIPPSGHAHEILWDDRDNEIWHEIYTDGTPVIRLERSGTEIPLPTSDSRNRRYVKRIFPGQTPETAWLHFGPAGNLVQISRDGEILHNINIYDEYSNVAVDGPRNRVWFFKGVFKARPEYRRPIVELYDADRLKAGGPPLFAEPVQLPFTSGLSDGVIGSGLLAVDPLSGNLWVWMPWGRLGTLYQINDEGKIVSFNEIVIAEGSSFDEVIERHNPAWASLSDPRAESEPVPEQVTVHPVVQTSSKSPQAAPLPWWLRKKIPLLWVSLIGMMVIYVPVRIYFSR